MKVPKVDRYDARPIGVDSSSDNVDEVFAKLKDSNTDPVLFAVTDDGYQTY